MTKYDVELLLADIEALMVSNLNAKITLLNTEKSDTITLDLINTSAYFLQELNGKQINYNPFILYGIESSQPMSQQGGSLELVTISVVIVIEDEGEDTAITKRMLRYRRCLKEVFEETFHLATNSRILQIQSLVPVAFQGLNSSANYRAVGVNIKSSVDS